MNKKIITSFLIMSLASSVLFGCAGGGSSNSSTASGAQNSGTSTASNGKEITIEFLHGEAEQERIDTIQTIIDDFQSKNPGIKVKQNPIAEDAFETKVTTLISSGKMPAITEASVDQVRNMDEEGVSDTEANKEVVDEKGTDKFYSGILSLLNSADGKGMVGVPISAWSSGIWYRKDLFEEKGLKAPTSWENILAAAKAFNDPNNKKYGILIASEESDFTEQSFEQFALSNNAQLFDKDGKPQFNSPAMKEAMKIYKELYGYALQGSNGTTQVKDAFIGGNTPMALYSTYIMSGIYDQKMADKVSFAVPENKSKAAFGLPSVLSISNSVSKEERDAAKKFVSFMLEKNSQVSWLHMSPGGANPVLKEITNDPDYTNNDLLKAFGDTALKVPESFNELQMFGVQDGKTNQYMGTISSKKIISHCINQILVQNANLDSEMDKAQKEMEEVVGK